MTSYEYLFGTDKKDFSRFGTVPKGSKKISVLAENVLNESDELVEEEKIISHLPAANILHDIFYLLRGQTHLIK
jgi:hypothetical protein